MPFCHVLQQFQTPIVKRNFHQTAANRKIIPFLLADIGEGITQVELKEWLIQEGQPVKQFQNVCDQKKLIFFI